MRAICARRERHWKAPEVGAKSFVRVWRVKEGFGRCLKGEGVIRSQKKKDLDGLLRKGQAGGRGLLTGAVAEVVQ